MCRKHRRFCFQTILTLRVPAHELELEARVPPGPARVDPGDVVLIAYGRGVEEVGVLLVDEVRSQEPDRCDVQIGPGAQPEMAARIPQG